MISAGMSEFEACTGFARNGAPIRQAAKNAEIFEAMKSPLTPREGHPFGLQIPAKFPLSTVEITALRPTSLISTSPDPRRADKQAYKQSGP
jgi:hypothetical protein